MRTEDLWTAMRRTDREAFDAATCWEDFRKAIRLPDNWDSSAWSRATFETAKAHPEIEYLAQALAFPRAHSFRDLFEEARLLEHKVGGGTGFPEGFRFVSGTRGNAAPCDHIGGQEYIRTRKDGRFFCFGRRGARFLITAAKPRPGVVETIAPNLFEGLGSFEAIPRRDGVLLIARSSRAIGSEYVAMLSAGSSLLELMPAEDQAAWRAHREREAAVEALVDGETVDVDGAARLGVEIRIDKY